MSADAVPLQLPPNVFAWFDEAIPCKTTDVRFHYTSLAGLIGIVTSKAIWATDARFLNDPGETLYAAAVIREAVAETCRTWDKPVADCARSYADAASSINENWRAFFVSLSLHGDLLNQWIAYTPAGAGVSLGMDPEFLSSRPAGFELRRVLYHPEEQRHVIRELLNRHREPFATALSQAREPTVDTVGRFFGILLLMCLLTFKDPAYSHEHEWRLCFMKRVSDTVPPVRFRPSAHTIVPYVELPLPFQTSARNDDVPLVRDVVVGPGVARDLPRDGISELLAGARIRPSTVPFRPMR